MSKIKFVVFNEYALGYIMPEQPDTVYTLADSVLRGVSRTIAPYYIGAYDTVRLANRQDFENFRVVTIPRCTSLTLTDNYYILFYLRLKRGTYERNRTIQANYQELS